MQTRSSKESDAMERRNDQVAKKTFIMLAIAIVLAMPAASFASEYETGVSSFTYNGYDIPAYDGDPSEPVNADTPKFSSSETIKEAYVSYGALDAKGRCTTTFSRLNKSLMPTWERGDISSVKPTGWIQAKYDIVPSGWLYNRCHLLGWQMTGADLTSMTKEELSKNLITGTRYLNVGDGGSGMVGYENAVASYIRKNSDNYVAYRVTPIFKGDNLVATGVLMEAQSIGSDEIRFCAFCYNVQPGIAINYATGESKLSSAMDESKPITSCTVKVSAAKVEYTGKAREPAVSVEDGSTTLKEGKDYKLTYKANVYPGKASISIVGIGSYKGQKTENFIIVPSKGAIKSAKGQKKGFKVIIRKKPNVTGYQIAYRYKNKAWKTQKKKGTTFVVTKLKKKAPYKVRVRSFKTIDSVNYYGEWSNIRTIKTK